MLGIAILDIHRNHANETTALWAAYIPSAVLNDGGLGNGDDP